MTTRIEFQNVGRFKRTWEATLTSLKHPSLYREVKRNGALLSKGIEFHWTSDTEGKIIVGGFRDVGSFRIIADE